MKKIAFLVLIISIFNENVFAQIKQKATITGKVNNAIPNGKIRISRVTGPGVKAGVDSTFLKKDNTFSIEIAPENGGDFYQIDIFDQQKSTLILENGDNVKIIADGKAGGILDISGSKNMDFYKKVNDVSNAMKGKTAVWEKAFQEATEKKDTKKQETIRAEYMAAQIETINNIKGFFPLMGTSLVALYATNFLNPQDEVPFLTVVAEKFQKTNPTNPQVVAFINQMKKLGGTTVGAPAPEISLRTPAGDTLALSSLKGKYVLIDFWASWCGPCRRENPNVVKMYEKFKGKPFEIYGVSLDKDHASWVKAIEADNLGWKHVSDLLYWNSSVVSSFGIQGIPQTYLLDKEGVIIAKNLRGPALEQKLDEVLGN